jgi:hypothetical protein
MTVQNLWHATRALACTLVLGIASLASAATISGDPSTDSGWAFGGNSLANGTYARGEGTFSFDIYTASFTVASGSSLEITDGTFSWLAGDEILGLGGKFVDTTAAAAGWPSFTPNPYNSGDGVVPNDDVSGSSRPVGKWATADSALTTSTIAPFAFGNGNSDFSGGAAGDGAMLARITNNRTSGGAGSVQLLDLVQRYNAAGATLISSDTTPNLLKVARGIYTWSNAIDPGGHIGSWEYLLNVSLLERQFSYTAYPESGDQAVMAVQRSTNRFTDGLVQTVPEPTALALFGLASVAAIGGTRRRQK